MNAETDCINLRLPHGWKSDLLQSEDGSTSVIRCCSDYYERPRILLTEHHPQESSDYQFPELVELELLCRFVIQSGSDDDPTVTGLILDRSTSRPELLIKKMGKSASDQDRQKTCDDLTQWLQERYPNYLDPTAYWNENQISLDSTTSRDQQN